MARVPVSQGPQVQSTALEGGFQRAPQSDAPFGGTAGRQMAALGQAGERAMDQIDQSFQRRAVEKAFEIENKIGEAYIKKRDELRQQRQLGNATGVAKDVEEWWTRDAQEIIGQVDPYTQKALSKSLSRRREQSLGEFTSFEREQTDKVGEINYETLQAETNKEAVGFLVAGNDAEAAVSLKKMQGAATAFLVARGVPPDAIKAEIEKRTAAVNLDVIAGLLADPKNAVKAKEFYAKAGVADSLTRRQRAEIESKITMMVDNKAGADEVQAILPEVMGGKKHYEAFEYGTLEKRLNEKFKDNPEALKAARSELDRAAAIWQRDQSEKQAAGADGAYEMLRSGASLAKIKGSPAWEQMSPTMRDQFLEQQENRWRANRSEARQDRQYAEEAEERRTAETTLELSDPARLASMTIEQLRAMRPALGERNYEKLAKTWQDFQGNQVKLSNAKFDNDMFGEVMLAAGLDPKPRPKDKDGAAAVLRARDSIDNAIASEQLSKGRELTSPEKRVVAQQVMAQRVLTGGLFGATERNMTELTPEEVKEAFVQIEVPRPAGQRGGGTVKQKIKISDIPAGQYREVEALVRDVRRARGDARPVTPADVAAEWYLSK